MFIYNVILRNSGADLLDTCEENNFVMSPEMFVVSGTPCCRLVQKAGVFVVTFLGSYHCGFSQVYGRHKSQNKHLDDSNKHKYEGDIVCTKRLSKNLFTKLDASTSNPYQPRQT